MIFKRGVRYPERIMNSSKSSTSLMLAGTASGNVLPVYVVYKAENIIWSTWTEGGPDKCRYNRSKSGWFDHICFHDWFQSVALLYCRKLTGKVVLIGDNLSSHFNYDILKECDRSNISFVCLPANATHLLQPLDVAFFRPMKAKWRAILTEYKLSRSRNAGTIPKDIFPKLLRKLMTLLPNQKENLVAGFEKCRIHPLSAEPVLKRLPRKSSVTFTNDSSVSEAFTAQLNELRSGENKQPRQRRRKINVIPGRSICPEYALPEPAANTQQNTEDCSHTDDINEVSETSPVTSTPIATSRPNVAQEELDSGSDAQSEGDTSTTSIDLTSEDEWLPHNDKHRSARNLFEDFN